MKTERIIPSHELQRRRYASSALAAAPFFLRRRWTALVFPWMAPLSLAAQRLCRLIDGDDRSILLLLTHISSHSPVPERSNQFIIRSAGWTSNSMFLVRLAASGAPFQPEVVQGFHHRPCNTANLQFLRAVVITRWLFDASSQCVWTTNAAAVCAFGAVVHYTA